MFAIATALAATASVAAQDDRPPFADWLSGLRADALARGISQNTIDQALTNLEEPLPVVIERDRSQAEAVLALETYLSRHLTTRVVRTARDMYATHQAVLKEITGKYGVPGRLIIAVWGMESNFGRFSGVRPTVASLATLAYDSRRSSLFRAELLDALEILDRGDIELASMRGSWAGAMGQPQFMPSSYLQFAEDFDGDGRRDIWSSQSDVFASIANFLRGHGWIAGQAWGREVKVSSEAARRIAASVAQGDGSCQARRNMTVALPLKEWSRLGVLAVTGRALPSSDQPAALVGGKQRNFLVYSNYDALLEYNCAHAYALSVALLANRIG